MAADSGDSATTTTVKSKIKKGVWKTLLSPKSVNGRSGNTTKSRTSKSSSLHDKPSRTSKQAEMAAEAEDGFEEADMDPRMDGSQPLIGIKRVTKFERHEEDSNRAHSSYGGGGAGADGANGSSTDTCDESRNQAINQECVNRSLSSQQERGARSVSFFEALNNRRSVIARRLESYNGLATASFVNGDTYSGAWKGGVQHGRGVYVFSAGDLYDGEWVEGKASGKAVVRMSDGRRYTGEMQSFERQGVGTMVYLNGGRYDGDWAGNKRSGKGTHKSKNGTVYEGQWKNNSRSGMGVFSNPRIGVYYNGRWLLDNPEGFGEYRGPQGLRYRCHFRKGIPHGDGSMMTADGRYYNGQLVQGTPQGYGTMYDPFGSTFSGTWVAGLPSNDGSYQTPEGSVYGGSWNEGAWAMSYGLVNDESKADLQERGKEGRRRSDWTLQEALEHPLARDFFIAYAQTCQKAPNLWFLLRCQAVQIRGLKTGSPELQAALTELAADFISKDAFFNIELSADVRDRCMINIKQGTSSIADCLSEAESELFRHIDDGLWIQFKNSPSFEDLKHVERDIPAGANMFSHQVYPTDLRKAFDFTIL